MCITFFMCIILEHLNKLGANTQAPFLGVGAGLADFSNGQSKELSGSLYAGAKYYFNEIIYAGAKFSYTSISGPEDKNDIQYKSIDTTAGSLLLGFEF